ncbi:hypothetical protein ACL03H_02730 [Saccharopolyspora sp. MS10]|uniref:hypothetical protein n=1 Tax=Saccharopolyspora sp. MS10 TaxID=3385973 RepID=UPI0039A079B4
MRYTYDEYPHVTHGFPAYPTSEQLTRWRSTIERHDHTAAPEDAEREPVWERAAAGDTEGLDANTAITHAAPVLSTRSTTAPMPASAVAADAVTATCADQSGRLPVPWLARADLRNLSTDEADYLHRLQLAIAVRVTELRETAVADPPRWAAGLGPRPDEPPAVRRWEQLLGQAAAFRETYGIDSTDPASPLGEPPDGQNLRSRGWRQILDRWTPSEGDAEPSTADTTDRLRAEFGEPLMATLTEPDRLTELRTEAPLSDTVHRHEQFVRTLLDQAARDALATHAPTTLGAPAEETLLRTLRDALRKGWQPHRLLPQLNDLDDARDPAALLAWRCTATPTAENRPRPSPNPPANRSSNGSS